MQYFKDLKTAFGDDDFLRSMVEWGLAWGILLGWLFYLLATFIFKDGKSSKCALAILGLSALLVWPAEHYRSRKFGPVQPYADKAAATKVQTQRRADHRIAFYALAAISFLTMFLGGMDKGAGGKFFVILTILGALAAFLLALWLQWHESKIFNPHV